MPRRNMRKRGSSRTTSSSTADRRTTLASAQDWCFGCGQTLVSPCGRQGPSLLRTAVAPTWDDISKLAVIATIRTMLNYFLAKDIMAFDKSQDSAPERGTV